MHPPAPTGQTCPGPSWRTPWCAPWSDHPELHAMALALLLSKQGPVLKAHHYLGRLPRFIHRPVHVLGGPAFRAACGGSLSLPWLPLMVVRYERHAAAQSRAGGGDTDADTSTSNWGSRGGAAVGR